MGQQDQAVRPTGTLAPVRPNPPQRILEGAENCLRSNAYLALKNVTCDYHEGVLTLRGCLPTYYLKQVAQSVVAHVEGVQRIVNEIEVVTTAPPLSRDHRQPFPPTLTLLCSKLPSASSINCALMFEWL